MLNKITGVTTVASLLFAGSLFLATPASADDDHWGFSLGQDGIGFHYEDNDRHHYRGHHGHHYSPRYYHRGYRYYTPQRYHYHSPYRYYYSPGYYYPGGLSFHFD